MRQILSGKFVALFFLIATSAQAQDNTGPLASKRLSVGLDVGYSKGTIFGAFVDFAQANYGVGYRGNPELITRKALAVDLAAYKRLFNFTYVKSGLGYARYGGRLTHTSSIYPVDIALDYITVPLGVGVNPRIFKSISVAVDGGLYACLEISSSHPFQDGIAPGIKQTNNKFIPGYFLSGSILYPVDARWAIKASYRYAKALKPFYQNGEGEYQMDMSSKATAFSGGIIYVLE